MPAPAPLLSVIVTIVDGGQALRRCLDALLTQVDAPAIEILVPIDVTAAAAKEIVGDVAAARASSLIRCIDLGRLESREPAASAAGQHELIDRRRAAGLGAARGDLIAILEDRGVPRPDWAAAIVRHHAAVSNLVIGGAVENGRDAALNWAVFLCDFDRYQRPFAPGPRAAVSDVNVAYKRRAIDETRETWRGRFHEPWVHRALAQRGETLLAFPDIVVDQVRDDLRIMSLIRERLAWGRLFGSLRAYRATFPQRLAWVLAAPFVPVVMFGRIVRDRFTKPPPLGRFLIAAPATILLLIAWAVGEAAGAFQREP